MTGIGIVVLAHGSRGERGASEVPEVLGRITQGLKRFLSPNVEITGAALQFNHPNLEEAAESLIALGPKLIVIAPYFLFTGRHLTEDIPESISKLKKQYPDIEFKLAGNLGLHDSLIELMAKKITETCPSLQPDVAFSFVSPDNIEEQSMRIIECMLPPELIGNERIVTQRIVHAGGDPSLSYLVKFSPTAISSGVDAIKKGCMIYTDVRMAATGISSRLTKAHGGSIICALDELPTQNQDNNTITRSAAAMYHLGTKLNSTIIAIGNAPTALLAVIDMMDNQQLSPALVVGMPVGFVQARESKAELMKRQVPYITIEGTRGGSPLAAATVNALLRLA